eukprot:TRINITY_DN1298_c1_g1_i1.p1 TRINITY_DN1298_c1_g1~~TRINITY_DN1298_c1_g1_i1.p1  ORF type:complete len:170 (-),score=12.75 TRINITY_DN1298_c1_g1_i1:54-563(-)
MVVWKSPRSEHPRSIYAQREALGTDRVLLTTQAKGKCDFAVMEEWVRRVLPDLPNSELGLLLLDGYQSHYATNVVRAARTKGWLILVLPPNRSAHLNVGDQAAVNRCVRRGLGEQWIAWAAGHDVAVDAPLPLAQRADMINWLGEVWEEVSFLLNRLLRCCPLPGCLCC